jgi:ribulose-phosphate 3-epimerase
MIDELLSPCVAPSLLSADFGRLSAGVELLLGAGARLIHVDVMDGHFVPNITVGPLVVAAIAPQIHAQRGRIDCHLMIERPELYVEQFAQAGADIITVHQEACPHLHRVTQQIREAGALAGVAVNPATSLSTLDEIRAHCDMVLVMSVNPGFGGQQFIATSLEKLRRARALLPANVALEVDGGVNAKNAADLRAAGANILVAGHSIFDTPDPAEAYRQLARAIGA